MSAIENRKTVETMWAAMSAMDWEALKDCLAPDVHYEDVPTEDPGASGPENVVKRLRIAFDHLSRHENVIHRIACEADVVFLEHSEKWTFHSGEQVGHTFVTVHELRDGKIARWSDYWDVNGFVGQFPAWFLEEMAKASTADFSD